jgi:DNA mismatch repair protein MutS
MKRVQTLAKQLMKIDVLQSLATVSMKHHYVRPEVRPEPGIWIEEGRHPVVEQTVSTFIANFTQLGGDRQIILITGPNMAGKSTYMRQVAMHVILAQMGCFVPAKRAVIGLVDKIFTRIGAADDLVGGQSTFMVEMSEIQHMLTNATARSLVIIDELGRGTSTFEGMAIAQSVIEYIHHHIGCLTLVSTHYHELASLAQTLERLHNYHMAVKEDGDNVLFLRKLVPGPADKSYGIYCAQIAGIPQTIIERAHELLNGYETREQLFQEAALSADNNEAAQLEEEQLNLFPEENDLPKPVKPDRSKLVLQRLKEADLMNMTPMQAMNFLHELKRKLH